MKRLSLGVFRPLTRCRQFSLSSTRLSPSPKVCIVGSGPAGFYAAQHLIKTLPDAEVDIYEALPVPFGLVRYGVAPDHPEVKNVINTFTKTAQSPSVRFIGNVTLSRDVSLSELRSSYNAVLLTYGADEDRSLNIPGEHLPNVLSARRFVGWYNSHPLDATLSPSLGHETAVVVGAGNVALDVARILLTPVDALRGTDIAPHALEALEKSHVKRVVMASRRGPLHVAFTIKELREMVKMEGCRTVMSGAEFAGIPEIIPDLHRNRKRLIQLLTTTALDPRPPSAPTERIFQPVFLRSPVAILPTSSEDGVSGVKLAVNRMQEERAVATGVEETMECGLVLRSVGYRSVCVDKELKFDEKQGLVPNQDGRVEPGLYVAGWLGTGPVGVILSTMTNAFSVGRTIEHDLSSCSEHKPGHAAVVELLRQRGVVTVDWAGWERIDKVEKERGKEGGRPRVKMISVEEMLEVAAS